MEPIRFADILFTVLTLLVIYLILFLVNKARRQKKSTEDQLTKDHNIEADESQDNLNTAEKEESL
ncbi:MAG: hypothetical protein JXQ81_14575 [Desulfuromonadales bacterium]|nr:hypothetical protein [Desulfuromonadales bacterium]MBN2793734.1 hypothetical protein [Desulfuromonadales bacterium]